MLMMVSAAVAEIEILLHLDRQMPLTVIDSERHDPAQYYQYLQLASAHLVQTLEASRLGSNTYTEALIRIACLLLGDSTDSSGSRDQLQSRADRDSTQPPRGSVCKEGKTEKKK